MLNQVQGRVPRRYVALTILFACIILFLWRPFRYPQSPLSIGDIRYIPSSYDWGKAQIHHPVVDMKLLPKGSPKTLPEIQARTGAVRQDDIANARKTAVRNAAIKSWEAYQTHAWTKDELLPLSGKGKQTFNGWSAQLVDALDTLWILDLHEEFHLAVKEVAKIDWARTNDRKRINVFEVTIRYLGGLIAAYDLSQEPVLRAKAVELADVIYASFDTPNRLPTHFLEFDRVKRGEQTADVNMSGAAGGTLCLEFTRLSQITGDPKYYDATERIKQFYYRFQNDTTIPGLWPHTMNYRDEMMVESRYTLGAGSDSMYEYLVKMHPLLGGLDPEYPEMAVTALDAIKSALLYRPMTENDENILLAGNAMAEKDGIEQVPEMQHLTCFAGGMYGLAGKLFQRNDYIDLATRLTAGCVWIYDAFPTNIMPEISELVACKEIDGPCPYDDTVAPRGRGANLPAGFVKVREPAYLLRPEAIESVFYMWRITGDQIWQDAAWRMWQGIVKETETELAFASIEDVTQHASTKSDSMETFWLAETLKYFYLIFDDESTLNLDEWVFNTEAHPFKRPV